MFENISQRHYKLSDFGLNKLSTIENIGNTQTIFVMGETKHSTALNFNDRCRLKFKFQTALYFAMVCYYSATNGFSPSLICLARLSHFCYFLILDQNNPLCMVAILSPLGNVGSILLLA
jgi:hypothetical protein